MVDYTITVDSSQVTEARQELKLAASQAIETLKATKRLTSEDKLAQHFASIDRQIAQTNRNMAQATRRFAESQKGVNQFGVVTQQAGYQIGDFLVQVQSGTNWMVAFGQQATQLAGVLPLMGAGFMGLSMGALVALSAGLGIAIPLVTAVGAAFMRTSDNAESGAGSVNSYTESISNLTSEIQKNQEAFLKAKFGTESGGIASARQQIEDLKKEIPIVRKQLDDFSMAVAQAGGIDLGSLFGDEGDALQETLDTLEEKLFVLEAQAEAQRMINGGLSVTAGIQKGLVYDKQQELKAAKELEEATARAHQIYAQTRMEANQVAEQVALIESGMSQAAVNALILAGVDLASPISAAAKEAAALAGSMGIALSDALSLINLRADQQYSGRGGDPRDFMEGGSKSYSEGFRPFVPVIPKSSGGGGGGGAIKTDPLADLRKQIELEQELLGVNEAMARVVKAVGDDRAKYSQAELDAVAAEIQAYEQKKAALEEQQRLGEMMKSSMEDAFMSIIDGTMSAKDAFKKMAYDMIKELYRVLVVQRLVGSFQSGGGGILGAAFGAFGQREAGGSIMPGQPYLVGERGPELIVPRHSATVLNTNQTSKATSGAGTTVVNNNITVTGSDAAAVRAEVTKMIPQIAQVTKAAVIDAKQRGGQMAAAFR
jgi:hypothetical protein